MIEEETKALGSEEEAPTVEGAPGPSSNGVAMPDAQRNSGKGNILEGLIFPDESQANPAEALFEAATLQDLVIRGDIPERMVPLIGKMLWKAERFNIGALQDLVKWYLLCRLGSDRQARREYMDVIMNTKKSDDDDDLLKQVK